MSAAALVERWPLVGRWELLETCAELLASRDRDGIVIVGPAGVGKTRLAEECRTAAADDGWTTARAIASRTAAATPLGALTHLLPPDVGGAEPGARFAAVAEALRAEPAPTGRLWTIDDAHLLDAASLILLSQLVTSRLVFVIATVRSDASVPEGLAALVRSERATRIDLPHLERDDVATLLHLALGGPVDATTTSAIWNATLGNVLFARELVHGSKATGALAERDGVWMLKGALGTTPRIADFVEDRIAGLDDEARHLLEAVASVESMGLDRAAELASTNTLARLEEQELVEVTIDGRRRAVSVAHPVYGEVLRIRTSIVRRQVAQREMADHVRALGARRREDALRIASWELASGGHADGDLLLRAAKVARYAHDFEQVERLAHAANEATRSIEAMIVLGEALFELGRFDEADRVLGDAEAESESDADVTAAAVLRSTNTFWGLLRPDDALSIRRDAGARVHDPVAADVLRAGEAAVLVFSGRPHAALDLIGPPGTDDEPRVRVARAIVTAPALALTGRTADAVAVAQQGFADHIALGDVVAITNPGAHLVAQVLALAEAGRLHESLELATTLHEVATAQRIPIARIWATLSLARVSLLQGQLATARRWFLEGAAICAASRYLGPRRLALAGLAMVCAQLGDADGATSAAGELIEAPGEFGFLQGEQALGRAWAAVARNELTQARALLVDAADNAARNGEVTSEAWLLHDLARLGAPAGCEERLAALAAASDSALVAARAVHVAALTRRDAEGLAAASESFEQLGATLLAAEAAAAASNNYRSDGDQRRAASARERSLALAARCEGAHTPGLVVADVAVALSARELDVARLAAAGLTSKEIGERLFIATRTVDNHLQRVFTKLGVTRRAELAEALDLRGPDA